MKRPDIIFRTSLGMTKAQLTEQCVAALVGIKWETPIMNIAPLGVSDETFNQMVADRPCFIVRNTKFLETKELTPTCAIFFNKES